MIKVQENLSVYKFKFKINKIWSRDVSLYRTFTFKNFEDDNIRNPWMNICVSKNPYVKDLYLFLLEHTTNNVKEFDFSGQPVDISEDVFLYIESIQNMEFFFMTAKSPDTHDWKLVRLCIEDKFYTIDQITEWNNLRIKA